MFNKNIFLSIFLSFYLSIYLYQNIDRPVNKVCSNDDIALGALKAVRESKTKKKIEFVGFDDTEKARLIAPELPTVRQPLYCMGKDSVNILLQKIKKRDKNPVQKAYRPKLIIRNIF